MQIRVAPCEARQATGMRSLECQCRVGGLEIEALGHGPRVSNRFARDPARACVAQAEDPSVQGETSGCEDPFAEHAFGSGYGVIGGYCCSRSLNIAKRFADISNTAFADHRPEPNRDLCVTTSAKRARRSWRSGLRG